MQDENQQKQLTVALRQPMAFDRTRLGMIDLANEGRSEEITHLKVSNSLHKHLRLHIIQREGRDFSCLVYYTAD